MRSLQFPFSYPERLSNVARALLLALLSTLFVIFPTSGLEPATAAPNPAAINFNDGTCDLNAAGYLGSGSSADPYLVSDSDALWEVTDCSITASAAAHFQITNDIDVSQAASAPTTSPIGYDVTPYISFSGVINGGNKIISGISMSTSSYGVGLFAHLHNATISNLVISGEFVTTTTGINANYAAGALAIRAEGSLDLSSISNQASVTGHWYVAGLVGYVRESANIISSHNSGAISGNKAVGGLVGEVDADANINSSFNTGTISGGVDHVGGLVGWVNANANINSSYNTGAVSGPAVVGGLVGSVRADANITSSYNTGPVSGSDSVGGLVGEVDRDANINSSYNIGTISGSDYVGGLVGYVSASANITSSHNIGTISGTADYVGGLVGLVYVAAIMESSYNTGPVFGANLVGGLVGGADFGGVLSSFNTGTISGSSNVGGLVGRASTVAVILSSYNTGPVSGAANIVGGLVGYGYRVDIESSYNTGTASGSDYVGGLVGYVRGDANITSSHNIGTISGTADYVGGLVGLVYVAAIMESSYNTGPVFGANLVGGLVGGADFGGVLSSFNTGTISGSSNVGGLVGRASTVAVILSSYNTGPVSGAANIVGGLVGYGSRVDIESSYNIGVVSGTTDVDGLAGTVSGTVTTTSAYTSVASDHAATSTVADMKLASTYVGFNFTNTWGFGSCSDNQGFPILRQLSPGMTLFLVSCGVNPPPQSIPSPGSTPTPVPVLPPLPEIDQTKIQAAAGNQQLLTGQRFELIRSATINGMPATISQLTATSLVLSIPALAAGNYSLDLETSNGRISFQGLVEVGGTSLNPAQLGSTFSVITGLNPRSSWLNRTALAELEQIFKGQSVVTCISYNDRPGLFARKKALSRAMHACRIADQLGLETRVFVYGKAPELADTVKILFR